MGVSGLTAGDLAPLGKIQTALMGSIAPVMTRDAFLAAVLDPPKPAGKLMAALRRHRDLLG